MYKNKFVLVILLLSNLSLAQSINEISSVSSQRNLTGDPITNVIDANAAKQGVWYFQNIEHKVCFSQVFLDHQLLNSSVFIEDEHAPYWKLTTTFNNNSSDLSTLKSVLFNQLNLVRTNHPGVKQLFVYQLNQQLTIELLGDWSTVSLSEFNATLSLLINNEQLNNDFFLFFE